METTKKKALFQIKATLLLILVLAIFTANKGFTKSVKPVKKANKESLFMNYLKRNFKEDPQIYQAFRKVLSKRDLLKGSQADLTILSFPAYKKKTLAKIVKGFSYATNKKTYEYQSMKLKEAEAIIDDLMKLIHQSPSLIIKVDKAESLPERAQQFISLIMQNKKEISISFGKYSKNYQIPEKSDISFLMVTEAGQSILRLTDNEISENQFKKSLRLEGFEKSILKNSTITLLRPQTRQSTESLIKSWITNAINSLQKSKNIFIILRDEQKLVDVILYHHSDNKEGLDYGTAKKNIDHLISKAVAKSMKKLNKSKRTLELYALNN